MAIACGSWRRTRCVPPFPAMIAALDLGEAEGGVLGRHADVGGEQQGHAAAEAEAVDGGDDRLPDFQARG